ncbi:AAA domain-containing protein [Actinoplanes rectilineatus]|uniref:AAA domain-containing protein n=1 Tax=Actinoplanes rectilineatus TaxID=113571 RepID=UPI0005F2D200|nr:AAA domain-containing protein [Actinoplanes rectilineatus]
MDPSTVLAVLGELAPATADRVLDVTRGGQPLVWLKDADRAPRKADVDRLAALDALHREERILHRGWGFLAGSTEIEGARRKIRLPLLSQPVRLDRTLTGYKVTPAGDVEITPLVTDRELAAALESAPGLGTAGWLDAIGSRAWLTSVADNTGLTFDAVTGSHQRLPSDRVVLVAAAGLFVVRDVFGGGLRDSLRNWAGRDLSGTALAAVYGSDISETSPETSDVLSPLPLSEAQARVVARARTSPITVVSGPPGNGKSHTVVAAALEVVHSGGSVLVATQSPHAAEVLAKLLDRYPGPTPVLFGDAELATTLAAGADQGVPARRLRADREAVQQNHHRVRTERTTIHRMLEQERLAAEAPTWQPRLSGLAADAPGAFDDGLDLPTLAARLADPDQGWRARWRRRRVRRRLRADGGVPDERMMEAISAAVAQRAAAHLAATGGTDLAPHWAALHEAEEALRLAVGTAMRNEARSEKRWDAEARRATAALATALRAGRNRRRELLARMDAKPLVRALPLWIGTVADVEDLLPAVPGLFDLVVIDEASHVDQIRAAPVLARARRALVVGDPRQLRFVSFVSDADVTSVLDEHGADDRLDVRRVSAYDLAAAAAPVTWLAEHYRSVPHLIAFSARRFYDDRIAVMTRTPAADAARAIDVVHVDEATVTNGVNQAEVTAVLQQVSVLAAAGRRGIGVITPFRAQAEALEKALIAEYSVERIDELALRVGTVHAFQGSEADTVVVSLGLLPSDAAGRRRFVTDPQLFNVMVTRARRHLILVTSLTRSPGLLGDYLSHAQNPTMPEPDATPQGWAADLAKELEHLDVPVRPDYTVGPWQLDLCAGPPETATGVLCTIHPDGVDAHLSRQTALHRAGWRVLDAFPTRWNSDPRRAALEIAAAVGVTGGGLSPAPAADS